MYGTNAAIDTELFTDTRGGDGNNVFTVNQGTSVAKAGTYQMFYRVSIVPPPQGANRYPQTIDSAPFTVELYDNCAEKNVALSVDPAFPTSLEYTLSDQKVVTLPQFHVVPKRCGLTVSSIHTVPAGGAAAFTTDIQADKILLTFDHLDDPATVGDYQLVFDVVSVETVTLQKSISLSIKNPCVDPGYFSLSGAAPS